MHWGAPQSKVDELAHGCGIHIMPVHHILSLQGLGISLRDVDCLCRLLADSTMQHSSRSSSSSHHLMRRPKSRSAQVSKMPQSGKICIRLCPLSCKSMPESTALQGRARPIWPLACIFNSPRLHTLVRHADSMCDHAQLLASTHDIYQRLSAAQSSSMDQQS